MLDTELIPATESDSKWLMVVLHGLGDSMEGYRWLPKALDLPWLNYLLVNAPDDYHGGFSWYDIYEDPDPGVKRSRKAMVELLDNHREAGFPSKQTFQFGFSQGCLVTMEIAMRYPHRLAGCIGISGYIHEPNTALKELSPVARNRKLYSPTARLTQSSPQTRLRASCISSPPREICRLRHMNLPRNTPLQGLRSYH